MMQNSSGSGHPNHPNEGGLNNNYSHSNDPARGQVKSSDSMDSSNMGHLGAQNAEQMQQPIYHGQNLGSQSSGDGSMMNQGGYSSGITMQNGGFGMQFPPGSMSQAPLLSGGNFQSMQPMHGHNMPPTDTYVSMPPNLMNPQYMNQGPGGASNGMGGSPMNGGMPQHMQQQIHHMGMPQQHLGPGGQPMMMHGSDLNSQQQAQYAAMPHRTMQGYGPMGGHPGMAPMGQAGPNYGMPPQGQQPNHIYVNQMMPGQQMMGGMAPQGGGIPSGGHGQQQFAPRAHVPKDWHNLEAHVQERNGICEEIVKLLKSRRPNANENWHDKLPHMAKKLEDALYSEADSFDEYKDRGTLKARLQKLAIQMGNGRGGSGGGSSSGLQGGGSQQGGGGRGAPMMGQMAPQQQQGGAGMPMGMQQQQQRGPPMPGSYPGQMQVGYGQQQGPTSMMPGQQGQVPQGGYMNTNQGYRGMPGPQGQGGVQQQQQQQQQQYGQMSGVVGAGGQGQQQMMMGYPPQQGQPGQGQMNAMDYNQQMRNQQQFAPMDPSLQQQQQGGFMMQPQLQQQPGGPGSAFRPIDASSAGGMIGMGGNNPMNMGMPAMAGQGIPGQGPGQQMMGITGGVQMQGAGGVPMPGQMPGQVGGGGNNNAPPLNSDEHRKQVLKQQQQRLLLLRHASKCPHDNGRCPVTPHCWGMKQLWKHIMSCKDQDCKIPHCVSSRYVLSHYSKCKEPACPVCGPVRDAIKKNYERSKEVVGIVGPNPSAAMMGGTMGRNNHPPPNRNDMNNKNKRQRTDGMNSQQTTLVLRPQASSKRVYPLDPISSAVYCFTVPQIEAHIRSIQEGLRMKVSKIRELCKPLLDELFRTANISEIFGYPVDPVHLGLPDYFEKIKCPMDLGTVMKKLDAGSYRDFEQMAADVRLTFDNAMLYNPSGSDVHRIAKNAKKDFQERFVRKIAEFNRRIDEDRNNPDSCTICGEIKLELAPPVYYCSGPCARAIKRNSHYHSNNAHTYYWCVPCFNQLRSNQSIDLPDCTISKYELERNKKQHNEIIEETWVECDGGCGRWVHQICALFNARRNVSDLPFVCPICLRQKILSESSNTNIVLPVTKPMRAADLPRTVLSDFLEKRLAKRLEIAYEETAENSRIPLDQVDKCPLLTLRQVSCIDKEQDAREGFLTRYADKDPPASFPCRVKCLVLFQQIDGQDVILFGMYVYEYGHNCPNPNQRRVYISYLDSVHFLRPKQYRTLVYHEILISYLDYVKSRGFHTAHIWACPPQKGDDYILHIHPPDQKTPRPQTLRIWYDEMLKKCVERGIVEEMTDLHTEYLTEFNNDATIMPYFEGDYWVNEAEVIIKSLNEQGKKGSASIPNYDDNAGQPSNANNAQANKRKNKNKKADAATTAAATANAKKQTSGPGPVTRQERDPLLAKLSTIIEPMKDTFFVCRLHPREYAERCAAMQKAEKAGLLISKEASSEAESKLQNDALSGEDLVPAIPADQQQPEKNAGDKMQEDDEEENDDFAAAAAMVDSGNNNAASSSSAAANINNSNNAGDSGGGGESAEQDGRMSTDLDVNTEQLQQDEEAASSSPRVKQEVMMDVDNNSSQQQMLQQPDSSLAEEKSPDELTGNNSSSNGNEMDQSYGSSPSAQAVTGADSQQGQAEGEQQQAGGGKQVAASSGGGKMMGAGSTAATAFNNIPSTIKSYDANGRRTILCGEDMPPLPDNTEDVDEPQPNEHFETRQSLLNLCQGNHYQFDQLRRAKHSSMMVLYHLHNPDAPKFVPTCSYCKQSIIASQQFHCRSCDVDFCTDCVRRYGQSVHQHSLTVKGGAAPTIVTEEQRKERERSIKLHMQLLNHAANCPKCESKNCARMKEFLSHEASCDKKAAGGCRVCSRMSNLLQLHARQCKVDNCRVPHCLTLREQFRRLQLSQMQMDDRRRQQMNMEYQRGGRGADDNDNED